LVAIIGPVLLLFICRRTAPVNRVKGCGGSRIEREKKGKGEKKSGCKQRRGRMDD